MRVGRPVVRECRLLPCALLIGCLTNVDPKSDEGGAVAAPEVDGEPRADHRQPSWVWTVPDGATGFRVRIDGSAWSALDVDTTWFTATSELADGEHLFEVAASDAEGLHGPSAAFTTSVVPVAREGDGFWRQDRAMATSPLGHPCAIARLTTSLDEVHAAQDAGADLIEIGLADAGASLVDLLADPALRAGDQVLLLDLDGTEPNAGSLQAVLDLLAEHRDDYARAGRHVVLRTPADQRAVLDMARGLLDGGSYLLLRPYIRFAVTFGRDEATRAQIIDAADRGAHLVDLEHRSPELMTLRTLLRARGVGVAVHGLPAAAGDVFAAALRESVDAVTTEAPVELVRAVVERPGALFHVDPSGDLDAAAESLPYLGTDGDNLSLAVNGDRQPLLRVGGDDDPLPGGRLVFDPAATRAGPLHDADTLPGGGVLVVLSVRLAETELPDDSIMTLVAKSDHSGWALDLENPEGADPTVMRFSVHAGGEYHYTTVPATRLSTTRAHLIIGAYDGDGEVSLWIDQDATGVAAVVASGGMATNDVPVLLGADPGSQYRYFFDGEINLALGQAWSPP